jgi:hypothetical protein
LRFINKQIEVIPAARKIAAKMKEDAASFGVLVMVVKIATISEKNAAVNSNMADINSK